jgi:hypothetical protein
MTLSPANARLRARSGSINSSDPLVSFLYTLLRDHVAAGVVEGIMQGHVEVEEKDAEFCNGFIASYAQELANRLRPEEAEPAMGLDQQFRDIQTRLHTFFAKLACATGPQARRIVDDPGAELLVMATTYPSVSLNLYDNRRPDVTLLSVVLQQGENPMDFGKRFLATLQTNVDLQRDKS